MSVQLSDLSQRAGIDATMKSAAVDLLPDGHVLWSGGVSMPRSIFNFTALIIGGGLLGWPYTFKLCGWLGALCCLLLVCGFAESTMRLMVNCAIHLRTLSYEETCCAVWGQLGYYLVALSCYMIDFGVLVSYWVALGDLAWPLARCFGWHTSGWKVKVVLAAFMLPFSFLRNLGKLPYWSYINYGLILFAALSTLSLAFNNSDLAEPDYTPIKDAFWPSLGTLSFTFVNHDSVFAIAQNLEDLTKQRWAVVCGISMWSTMLLTALVGMPVYFALGEATLSDITMNFPLDSPLMNVVRFALTISLAMTWLYLQQVGRKFLHSLVMPMLRCRVLSPGESYHMSRAEIVAFTSVQFGVTLYLGCIIEDLGLPMALTGVFAQAMAAFVIPPCLLLTLSRRGHDCGYTSLQHGYYVAILIFGIVSCTLGVNATLDHYNLHGEPGSHA